MQALLVGASGGTVGQSYTLGPETSVGRDAGNTIALNDSTVSRNHARIQADASGYVLLDLGSSNGTTVNGARVSGPVRIGHGDQVSFGAVQFRVEVPQVVPKIVETSSREAGFGQPLPAVPTDAPGCLPGLQGLTGDIGSLASWIARLTPYLLILLLVLLILSLLVKIGSALMPHGDSSPSQTSPPTQQQPPPPQNQQPPTQNPAEQDGKTVEIQILSAKLVSVNGVGIELLVDWKNTTDQPIKQLKGNLVEPDSGVTLATDVTIYSGAPVQPGAEHIDQPGAGTSVSLPSDAVALPQKVNLDKLRAQ